ncbi:MAG: C40 family peptidase [Cardiobacteriaceae bacterium]|nr:C40 family peptidase [Cardiobacteriaceae bacterium]
MGTPYLWGGTTPKGFDCSGLVQYLYHKQGISVPRNSREQFAHLPAANSPQPGDLVFFRRNGKINHVGLYLGSGKMLHSPQTGSTVRIENIDRPKWQRRYAGARRALKADSVVIASRSTGKKVSTKIKKGAVEQRIAKRTIKENKTISSKGKVLTSR